MYLWLPSSPRNPSQEGADICLLNLAGHKDNFQAKFYARRCVSLFIPRGFVINLDVNTPTYLRNYVGILHDPSRSLGDYAAMISVL